MTSELERVYLAFCLFNARGHSEMPLHPPYSFSLFLSSQEKIKSPQNVNVLTHWNDRHMKGKNDKEVKAFDFKKIAKCLNL